MEITWALDWGKWAIYMYQIISALICHGSLLVSTCLLSASIYYRLPTLICYVLVWEKSIWSPLDLLCRQARQGRSWASLPARKSFSCDPVRPSRNLDIVFLSSEIKLSEMNKYSRIFPPCTRSWIHTRQKQVLSVPRKVWRQWELDPCWREILGKDLPGLCRHWSFVVSDGDCLRRETLNKQKNCEAIRRHKSR